MLLHKKLCALMLLFPAVTFASLLSISPTTPFPATTAVGSTTNAVYTVMNASTIPLTIEDQTTTRSNLPSGVSVLPSSTCTNNHLEQPSGTCVVNLQLLAPSTAVTLAGFNLYEYASPSAYGQTYAVSSIQVILGNVWTWESGSTIINQNGIYGIKGTAAPGNVPGARGYAVSWIDSSGNLWLFGGVGYPATGTSDFLNDLWKFNGTQWTWVSGANITDQNGDYGIKGTAAPGNVPGARSNSVSWIDSSGNLWLFGGYTIGAHLLNDLWKFNGTEWTWVSGSNAINQNGTYGTEGTAAPGNVPGARYGAVSWSDSSGNLWLFGGQGYPATGTFGYLNDLWKYTP